MKIVHLSDLHLGKRLNDFSLIDDQKYILTEIINVIDDVRPQAVVIAGDVYDRTNPSGEAVQLLDEFLCRLAERKLQVFVISGNHDSAERLSFASRLIDMSGVHISRVYDGNVEPVTLEDEYGPVNFYMLPFIKPIHVRSFFPEAEINSYTDAFRCAVEKMKANTSARNVMIAHQFVTGATRSESEEISVGGTDNIDASVFDGWDYVALGHIHGPQNIGNERIRYCGTPLKYSFSEAGHTKSVTVIELGAKGSLDVTTVPLVPKHDLREIRGTYSELISREFYAGTETGDYIRATFTDEQDIPDAMTKMRTVYPRIMEIRYDNKRTGSNAKVGMAGSVTEKSPLELFSELYEIQNGQPMSDEQREYMNKLITEIWEGDHETD